MSNINVLNNVSDPDLAKLKELEQSLIGNNNSHLALNDEPEEELDEKGVELSDDELFRFKGIRKENVYSVSDIAEISELNEYVFKLISGIFADTVACNLVYEPRRGWIIQSVFRYMLQDQFDAVVKESDSTMYRVLSSTVDPNSISSSSVAQTLLKIVDNQTTSNSDITKYASITKDAKELLTSMAWFDRNNKKRKWIKDDTYKIDCINQPAFNGQSYNNIIATVYLDAEKVLDTICSIAKEKGDWEYSIVQIASKVTKTDALIKIIKTNKSRKRKIASKYGVCFNKN